MIGWLIRLFISVIFILSILGKLFDHTTAAFSMNQLFGFPEFIAELVAISWSILEVGLVILIWRERSSKIILAIPLALLGVTLFSYWRDIDCGCFGSLPYLSQFSFGGHLLLLAGMFLGLYYLTASPKVEKVTEDSQSSETSHWTGMVGIVMMSSAFLTLPFTSSDSQAPISTPNETIGRAAVEAAIANHSAVIIDARPEYQFDFGHIPTAINIPYDSDSLSVLIEKHSLKNHAIIVYCSSAHCNAAELLAEKLRELSCKNVQIYPGGWEGWVSGRDGDGVKR